MPFVPLEGHQRVVAGYTVGFFCRLCDSRENFIVSEPAVAAGHAEMSSVVFVWWVKHDQVEVRTNFCRQFARIGNKIGCDLGTDINERRAGVLLVEPDSAVAGRYVEDLHGRPRSCEDSGGVNLISVVPIRNEPHGLGLPQGGGRLEPVAGVANVAALALDIVRRRVFVLVGVGSAMRSEG